MKEPFLVRESEELYVEHTGGILSDTKKLYFDSIMEGCEEYL